MPTFDEIKGKYASIMERFTQQHMCEGPLRSCVVRGHTKETNNVYGCGFTIRKFVDSTCPPDKKEEVCFIVLISQPFPEDADIPHEFEGVKVYYKIMPQAEHL